MALFPEDRYARMRNVWFVPTANCMKYWLHKAKFKHIEIVFDELLTNEEQRVTKWSGGASLDDFLDPQDSTKPSKDIRHREGPQLLLISNCLIFNTIN